MRLRRGRVTSVIGHCLDSVVLVSAIVILELILVLVIGLER